MIQSAHKRAAEKYQQCVKAYYDAEAQQVNSFAEHNEASYWKGRRDALRHLMHHFPESGKMVSLPNAQGHPARSK